MTELAGAVLLAIPVVCIWYIVWDERQQDKLCPYCGKDHDGDCKAGWGRE